MRVRINKLLASFSVLFLVLAPFTPVFASAPVVSAGANPPTILITGFVDNWALFNADTDTSLNYGNDGFFYPSMTDGEYSLFADNTSLSYGACHTIIATCLASSPDYRVDFWIIGGVYSATPPAPAIAPTYPGGFSASAQSSGILSTLADYGAGIAIILATAIGLAVAYLIFRYGYARVKDSAK